MDEARLSERERRILAEIEQRLEQDRPLARRLRPRRHGPPGGADGARRRPAGLVLGVLGAVTLALLVLAVATEAPLLIWGFAASWVLTLVLLLRLVVRWARRRTAAPRTPER
ncbi:DUF3040 domain-containing protein [Streptomyces sp. NPDC057193]|uniref:DUF3040 domain-containing protein n=1 Tax=unclassified Streptomyces TaxID=2593676 RepID=UPI00093E7E34|nr:DUF3040 domain-containing protein [Streptomyces sp. CB02261]OKJ63971.1 hypothetical protein AMK29_17845 [Streptomyces sp. CB02261]